jgi:hypothetical protein
MRSFIGGATEVPREQLGDVREVEGGACFGVHCIWTYETLLRVREAEMLSWALIMGILRRPWGRVNDGFRFLVRFRAADEGVTQEFGTEMRRSARAADLLGLFIAAPNRLEGIGYSARRTVDGGYRTDVCPAQLSLGDTNVIGACYNKPHYSPDMD